ncbi:MAG TPA: hypothetical protein VGK28_12655 [Candidatus Dormibacteraeota bacterium]
MLYTAVAARGMVESRDRPENGRSLRVASFVVLAANLVLMALPPAIGILVLGGLLG